MVTPDSTYVIDAEFAFAGPIAFDVAKFVFDLLLTYVALEGHKGGAWQRRNLCAFCCVSGFWASAVPPDCTTL